ncbi:MAG: OmpA family protein, partial [Gammaproteobacteria bacterium]|nr:OmpA family protein [Gammaproteobacteria bacterium]
VALGTLTNNGSLVANGASLSVSGNWNNLGTFTANTSTVNLTGANQTLSGSTAFYHLSKVVTVTDTLTFTAGTTTSVAGTATLQGAAGQLLLMRSSTPGTMWSFTLLAGAAKAMTYLDVRDSDASNSQATLLPIGPTLSVDSGNNLSWFATVVTLSGTLIGKTQADVQTGGNTLLLTVASNQWAVAGAAFDAQRQNIINGLVSAQAGANGWNARVIPALTVANVVRTSNTVVTITFPAVPSYSITAPETITATVPSAAFRYAAPNTIASTTLTLTPLAAASYVADANKSTVLVSSTKVLSDGIAFATITVRLRDSANAPVPNKAVTLSTSRGLLDALTQPGSLTDANGETTATIRSSIPGATTLTAVDVTDGVTVATQPRIGFTQGVVLQLDKSAKEKQVVVGDTVSYRIIVRNLTPKSVTNVTVVDDLPIGFKFVAGSARINGVVFANPSGSRSRRFTLGTVPGWVDSNRNGKADVGEAGYLTLDYKLVAGTATVKGEASNRALAVDCDFCEISNTTQATVAVVDDPVFDLGTLIGKVFNDTNQNGVQDAGETGIAKAMVVLDTGVYVLTDNYGRFHFKGVSPGEHLVKLNLLQLPSDSRATTEEAQVVSVTPGVLAKVNFGVTQTPDKVRIGHPAIPGVAFRVSTNERQVMINGSVSAMTLLIDEKAYALPKFTVDLVNADIDNSVDIAQDRASHIEFTTVNHDSKKILSWSLHINDSAGALVKKIDGLSEVPARIAWDGDNDKGEKMPGGAVYSYQMHLTYEDGTSVKSGIKLFAVNESTALTLKLDGSLFELNSFRLTEEAKERMLKTADELRKYSKDKIVVEGHTDAQGSKAYNLELSRNRAEAVQKYLLGLIKISERNMIVKPMGDTVPVADNATAEGREKNRRVEIKVLTRDYVRKTELLDQFRQTPAVKIKGRAIALDENGRFTTVYNLGADNKLDIEMMDEQGAVIAAQFTIPRIGIVNTDKTFELEYGESSGPVTLSATEFVPETSKATIAQYVLVGQTEPGVKMLINEVQITTDKEGKFIYQLNLTAGKNVFAIKAINLQAQTRYMNLFIDARTQDAAGAPFIVDPPVPNLEVGLPAPSATVSAGKYLLSGNTTIGNVVMVNEQQIIVDAQGQFAVPVDLHEGKNRVRVNVADSAGNTGKIEREILVETRKMFMLAFVDGHFQYLKGKGMI